MSSPQGHVAAPGIIWVSGFSIANFPRTPPSESGVNTCLPSGVSQTHRPSDIHFSWGSLGSLSPRRPLFPASSPGAGRRAGVRSSGRWLESPSPMGAGPWAPSSILQCAELRLAAAFSHEGHLHFPCTPVLRNALTPLEPKHSHLSLWKHLNERLQGAGHFPVDSTLCSGTFFKKDFI